MDLISSRATEITKLALDGLSTRHKVLSSNIANAQTPGFQKSEVVFEDQLQQIIQDENLKESVKINNSMGLKYNPASLNSMGSLISPNTSSSAAILKHNSYQSYKPRTIADSSPAISTDGNNVNIEVEMTELMKNGTKFTVLSELEGKMYNKISEIIKGAV